MVWGWIPLSPSKAVPEEVQPALEWLRRPGESESTLRVAFNNLALAYAAAYDYERSFGKLAGTAAQLQMLASAADALAVQLRDLNDGGRRLLASLAKGADRLRYREGNLQGVLPQVKRIPHGPGPLRVELEGATIEFGRDAAQAQWVSPPWLTRTQALADASREAARRAALEGQQGGRRTIASDLLGSPELQLLVECAKELHAREKEDAYTLRLARVVHELVTGEAPSRHWAKEAHRLFRAWWVQVKDAIGEEAKAPEEIRKLIEAGPQSLPKRAKYRPKKGA